MLVKNEYSRGISALILLAAVSASMGIWARILSTQFTILQQVYLRVALGFVLAIIVFRPYLHIIHKLRSISLREWTILILRAILTYVLGVTLFSKAVVVAKLGNVSLFFAAPFIAIYGFVLFRERVTVAKILYLFIGVIGVLLIAISDIRQGFIWGLGELLALVAAASISLGKVARKWNSDILNNKEMAVVILGVGAVLLFILSGILGESLLPVREWHGEVVFALFIAGIANVAFMFLINYGFQKVSAVVAGNILMLETLFAVVFGYVFYAELMSLRELTGGVLIIVSAYQMSKLRA